MILLSAYGLRVGLSLSIPRRIIQKLVAFL